VIISTNDKATITLTYTSPCGATAKDSFTFALSNDTTVVGWIDPGPIAPSPGQIDPTDLVYTTLTDPFECAGLLLEWSGQGRKGVGRANSGLTDAERQFVIQYLNAGSGNHAPNNPNNASYVNGQDYRLYNRFQAYYEISNGAINPSTVKYLNQLSVSGVSPEPCTGLQILSVA